MKTRKPDTRLDIARRIAKALGHTYFQGFGGTIPLSDFVSIGNEAAAHALHAWNGEGDFAGFAGQQIRWTILRLVERQILRHRPGRVREEACAMIATERTADSYDPLPEEEPVALPTTRELMEESLDSYRVELAYVEEQAAEVADSASDEERAAERMDLRRAIERLPPPDNVIVAHSVYEGLTVAEIAKLLKMSRSTVHRAVQQRKEWLVQQLRTEPRTGSPPARASAAPIPIKRAAPRQQGLPE